MHDIRRVERFPFWLALSADVRAAILSPHTSAQALKGRPWRPWESNIRALKGRPWRPVGVGHPCAQGSALAP
eukprot:7279508-Alexandrium_andersonii.AAC.1